MSRPLRAPRTPPGAAETPADMIDHAACFELLGLAAEPLGRRARRSIASAIGLRHVLPVQTMTISMLASRSRADARHHAFAQAFDTNRRPTRTTVDAWP